MDRTATTSTESPSGTRRKRGARIRKPKDFSKMHPDQNMTEEDASDFLCLSRQTLRNLYKPGGLYLDESFPAPKPMGKREGCAIRYRFGSVAEWSRKNHGIPPAGDAVTPAHGGIHELAK